MNYLIGDIGNTNIKICKINKNFKIINTYLFNTKSLHLEKEINKKFKSINKVVNTNVLFSSVVPKAFKKIKKVLQKKKNLKYLKLKILI